MFRQLGNYWCPNLLLFGLFLLEIHNSNKLPGGASLTFDLLAKWIALFAFSSALVVAVVGWFHGLATRNRALTKWGGQLFIGLVLFYVAKIILDVFSTREILFRNPMASTITCFMIAAISIWGVFRVIDKWTESP